jgi:hypothetical protein
MTTFTLTRDTPAIITGLGTFFLDSSTLFISILSYKTGRVHGIHDLLAKSFSRLLVIYNLIP